MKIKDFATSTLKKCRNVCNKFFLGKKARHRKILFAVALNILLSYAILAVCQIIFILVNYNTYATSLTWTKALPLFTGFITFATPSVGYINAVYLLLTLFPLHYKEGKVMQYITKATYIIPNALGVIANLCDCIYVRYIGRRTTWDVFNEFSNDDNIGKIIGIEIANNWWLVLIGIIMIAAIFRFYTPANKVYGKPFNGRYYIGHIAMFFIIIPAIIIGIRGGISRSVRPITLSNANFYVTTPNETALVLNTPFTIIRTMGRKPFSTKNYFTESEIDSIFTPVKKYESATYNKKNIVVFIIEGFGEEYIGAYNPRPEGSLTPFLDSLIKQSKSYLHSYGNGRKSIDGMPSILSSIPMFVTPFVTSSAELNDVSSLAEELGKIGYNSAFFHGAPNGSMGFQAFSKAIGFDKYYGMTEYCKSPDHNGKEDYDGNWAIWDEPFLQYYAECMNEMEEPFITTVFTATSHHPYNIPEEYQNTFLGGEDPFYKCVQYTDFAIQRFFEYAKEQPWYNNTLFVLSADHTNHSVQERYKTPSGELEVPVIFFLPSEEAPFEPGIDSTMIAQQIDIMPTVLEYIGYDKPFVAFGKSLISTPTEKCYVVNYANEAYRYYKGDYILLYDGESDTPLSVYNLREDIMMKNNILDNNNVQDNMTRELQAIIQQYMNRMVENKLTIDNDTIR